MVCVVCSCRVCVLLVVLVLMLVLSVCSPVALVSCEPVSSCSLSVDSSVTLISAPSTSAQDIPFILIAKQQPANFVFTYTTGNTARVQVYGGPNAQVAWTYNVSSTPSTNSLSLRVEGLDLSGSGNGASRLGSPGSHWLTTVATTTVTSTLLSRSRYAHSTPLVLGAAAAAAGLAMTQFAGADAATACSDPVIVITLPALNGWGDPSRVFRMDVSQAWVSSATCPTGQVWHSVYGCSSLFRSVYQLQWSDPLNNASCTATLPQQVSITSAQGNYLTLIDNDPTVNMIPFTTSWQEGYGRITFTTMRDNEQATVLAWIDTQQNTGFAAVQVTTPTRTCNAGYTCVTGTCALAATIGSRRCAHYSYQTNSTTCPRNFSPDYSACPSLSCDTWCPVRVGDPCTSSCPATLVNEPVCRANGTCHCALVPGRPIPVNSASFQSACSWRSTIMTAALAIATLVISIGTSA